ncbi:endonuclease/exonuclease/phosphatase family protein [Porticoccus sp. GXU_MW_L64]
MYKAFMILAVWLVMAGQSVVADEQNSEIKLLSYNILVDTQGDSWHKRKEGALNTLTSGGYDIIAIQEASEMMISDYQKALDSYHYVVGERSDGHRGDQKWYEYLPIFFHADRFERISSGSFWIGEEPYKPGDTLIDSKWHGRVFTWILLKRKSDGMRVAVGNVHMHGKQSDRAVELVSKKLGDYVGEDVPVILAGDFNFEPDKKAYKKLTGEKGLGFLDAREVADKVEGQEHTLIGFGELVSTGKDSSVEGFNPRRIDYVFVPDYVTVSTYKLIKSPIGKSRFYPSDHFPLEVHLSVPENMK